MKHARRARQLLTHLGLGWVAFRLRYALRKKSGALIRRAPAGSWTEAGAAKAIGREPALFQEKVKVGEGCVTEAEAILSGRFRLFSHHEKETGFPPLWHRNPLTGQTAPADVHWSRIGDFGSGDIKGVWELSRFPWAWPLARAYRRTGDERFAEGFWELFENWLACNPPNRGANWMCGQEATFRLIAATFARHVLAKANATTPARVAKFQEFVRATARRIAVNLDYALSQSNNHGVSECLGLITSAVILPDVVESGAWQATGLRALKQQLDALVYPDGGFAQHSATYHRVLLHDLLWGVALLRSTDREVPAWLTDAAQRALGFIDALITPATGRVPLYGANDGANILPLADADYLDFRPVVQAGFAVLHGTRRFPPGPWDEAADWLAPGWQRVEGRRMTDGGGRTADHGTHGRIFTGGNGENGGHRIGREEAQKAQESEGGGRRAECGGSELRAEGLELRNERPIKGDGGQTADDGCQKTEGGGRSLPDTGKGGGRTHFQEAGVAIWRLGETRLFLRCPEKFRHRPSQADLLHVDLEWRGQPIAIDAGTYSYNTAGPFAGGMKEAALHNTLMLDGAEPLEKVGRFLYLPWPVGRAGWNGTTNEFVATHDGWARLGMNHERRLGLSVSDRVVVTDRVRGAGLHRGRLHWLLADLPYRFEPEANRLILTTPCGDYAVTWTLADGTASLVRADPGTARGWWSPYYAFVAPALSLAIEFDFSDAAEVSTIFAPV